MTNITATDDLWHIYSPALSTGKRKTLCGSPSGLINYEGLNDAYRACVEGWPGCKPPCSACLGVAMIAMGANP